jgi:hypothetical protein
MPRCTNADSADVVATSPLAHREQWRTNCAALFVWTTGIVTQSSGLSDSRWSMRLTNRLPSDCTENRGGSVYRGDRDVSCIIHTGLLLIVWGAARI